MSVTIKSPEQLELMREAGKILAKVHEQLGKELKPGMSTYEIDRIGEEMIRSFGCIPSFKNYCGYPASVCVSIDEEVVHGIPSREKFIQEGDIVSLDIGVIHKGYHSDAARTHAVGTVSKEAELLMERTRQSFFEGMKYATAGRHLHEISRAIGDYAESFGYGVVRDLCGHGIGTHLHEDPDIPNFRQFRRGIKLRPGMTLAIEPMINIGTADVAWLDDEWTVVTQDMSLSAHYENTIIITDGKPEILTLTDSEIASHIWEPQSCHNANGKGKNMELEFAKSLSGHDRNQYYLVVKKEEQNVYLVNGTTKSLDSPKKKNRRHIQIIRKLPDEVREALEESVTDLTVKRAIKLLEKQQNKD